MEKVTDHQLNPGKWEVSVRRNGGDNDYLNCQNRPAISYGDQMIRIADVEFEVWIPNEDIQEIHCHSTGKKTLIQLVEQMEPERLHAYAKNVRAESDNEDDFQVAQILAAAADMYEDIAGFLEPRERETV